MIRDFQLFEKTEQEGGEEDLGDLFPKTERK